MKMEGLLSEIKRELDKIKNWKHTGTHFRRRYSAKPAGFLLGVTNRIGRRRLSNCIHNKKYPKLLELATEYAMLHNFSFNCIQVNKTLGEVYWHKDKANGGEKKQTGIVGIGDYEGGLLEVQELGLVGIHNKFFTFDAVSLEHRVTPHTGTRFSLVFFTACEKEKGCSCLTHRCTANPPCTPKITKNQSA